MALTSTSVILHLVGTPYISELIDDSNVIVDFKKMFLTPNYLFICKGPRVEDRMRFTFIYPTTLGNDIHIPLPTACGSATILADDYSIQLTVGRGNTGFFGPQKNPGLGSLSAFSTTCQETNAKTSTHRDKHSVHGLLSMSHCSPLQEAACP